MIWLSSLCHKFHGQNLQQGSQTWGHVQLTPFPIWTVFSRNVFLTSRWRLSVKQDTQLQISMGVLPFFVRSLFTCNCWSFTQSITMIQKTINNVLSLWTQMSHWGCIGLVCLQDALLCATAYTITLVPVGWAQDLFWTLCPKEKFLPYLRIRLMQLSP